MKTIKIKEVNNGFQIDYDGGIYINGPKVYEKTHEFKMLEELGEFLLGYKIEIKTR